MVCMRNFFRVGDVLQGRYKTVEYIHRGSFGMVFKAKDLWSGNFVAIKCLTKKSAVVDPAEAEFALDDKDKQELDLHKHLGYHPNLVSLLDHFETSSHLYLVLEYCERGDLYEAIRAGKGPSETEDVRRIMLEIIDAVAYLHSKGVFHRDIKPENIFLTETGNIKLGDFGLSTQDEFTLDTCVGSDRYMSPEQFETDGDSYKPRQADIWAIGVCLLNILFAKNPFEKPTQEDAYYRDFCHDRRALYDIFPDMAQETFNLLEYSLSLDPDKRSLQATRQAIVDIASFKTLDCDEFCDEDGFLSGSPRAHVTINREPLGTPAIQSPAVDQGGFDNPFWTKALHKSPPQPIRGSKLSAVEGIGSYTEDLFAKSAESDWCSADTVQSYSLASTNSVSNILRPVEINLTLPEKYRNRFATKVSPTAGSLPIAMTRPKPIPSLSMVFGRQDGPKSWSDMVDEDEEAEEMLQLSIQENNARTFSHDKPEEDVLELDVGDDVQPSTEPALGGAAEDKEDCLFDFEPPSPKREPKFSWGAGGHYTPAKKSTDPVMDKWARLGERRRAACTETASKKPTVPTQTRRTTDVATGAAASNFTTESSTEFTRSWRYGSNNEFSFGTGHGDYHSTSSYYQSSNHHSHAQNRSGQPRDGGSGSPWRPSNHRGGAGRPFDIRNANWRQMGPSWVGSQLLYARS